MQIQFSVSEKLIIKLLWHDGRSAANLDFFAPPLRFVGVIYTAQTSQIKLSSLAVFCANFIGQFAWRRCCLEAIQTQS
jgi:hypothetical protein